MWHQPITGGTSITHLYHTPLSHTSDHINWLLQPWPTRRITVHPSMQSPNVHRLTLFQPWYTSLSLSISTMIHGASPVYFNHDTRRMVCLFQRLYTALRLCISTMIHGASSVYFNHNTLRFVCIFQPWYTVHRLSISTMIHCASFVYFNLDTLCFVCLFQPWYTAFRLFISALIHSVSSVYFNFDTQLYRTLLIYWEFRVWFLENIDPFYDIFRNTTVGFKRRIN